MSPESDLDGFDDQDRAEVLDETNMTPDGEFLANFDEIPDVYDATAADGDEDEDEDEDVDDPVEIDELDDEDLEEDEEGVALLVSPEPRSLRANEDGIGGDIESPADFEPDQISDEELRSLGYGDDAEASSADAHADEQLDRGLKDTFPASDPVSVTRGHS